MLNALVVLSIATLLVALVALFLGLRARSARPQQPLELRRELESVEQRTLGELGRLRAELTAMLQGDTHQLLSALNEREARASAGLVLFRQSLEARQREDFEAVLRSAAETRLSVTQTLAELGRHAADSQAQTRDALAQALLALALEVRGSLEAVRQDTALQLERIRGTVDEKLQQTLETRLGESFRSVSERLAEVHKGLGEMHLLATGVGDLKKVLGNVKQRGTFGEAQASALLEDMLAPDQFARNVETVPHSGERVELAVKLPGPDDGGPVWLPIDAKFPHEDHARLQDAYESGDADLVARARNELKRRFLFEADKIRTKYVSPPHTTDLALLFVPTESLYAEALRTPELWDELVKRRVVLVGPATLFAVLGSLQMGFRTLAIQKRTDEAWRVLGAVKTEFGKFGEALDAVQKKLQEASNKIDDASKRQRAVDRKLRSVEALPVSVAQELLGTPDEPGSS